MNPPSLTKITLEGYKSFRKLELELRPLNVLIGANGVGKSNLVSFFILIKWILLGRLQNLVATEGSSNAFLRYGKQVTKRVWVQLEFGEMVYEMDLRPNAMDSLSIESENLYQTFIYGIKQSKSDRLFHSNGTQESVLWSSTEHPENYKDNFDIFSTIRVALDGIRVYHFGDTRDDADIQGFVRLNDNINLRSNGNNLAAILYRIHSENLKIYQTIRDVIRSIAPYFDDFLLRPNPLNTDWVRIEWREHGSDYPFLARDLSDGTLRFMALTTLLLQPEPPAIIVIDEPELGLHPFAIEKLAGLLRIASSRAQLIVATQSPQLIAALEPEDIIVADRKDGETTMQRLDAASLEGWLEEYTLGELWQKNILGGVVNPNTVRSRSNS